MDRHKVAVLRVDPETIADATIKHPGYWARCLHLEHVIVVCTPIYRRTSEVFVKFNYLIFGYFHPTNIFCYSKNK